MRDCVITRVNFFIIYYFLKQLQLNIVVVNIVVANMYLSWQCARSKNRIVSLMQQLQIQSQTARTLYSSTLKFQENKQVQENPKQDAATGSSERVDFAALNRAYKPNGLEKRILVWTGKYKSIDEIPGMVR